MIFGSVEKPSRVFSARDLKFNNLLTSVLGKVVGGSRFMVKVSGAVKLRGGWFEVEGKAGNIGSRNL